MNKNLTIAMTTAMLLSGGVAQTQAQDVNIGKSKQVMLKGDIMTPETLWAMGRVGSAAASPDGKQVVYQVGYYSVKENRGHQVLFIMNADGTGQTKLTTERTASRPRGDNPRYCASSARSPWVSTRPPSRKLS